MLKSAVFTALLVTSNAAWACGGKACAHCDEPSTAAVEDISKAPGTHVSLAVEGMKCGACSEKITKALRAIDGVNAVSVDHESGQAKVAYDAKKTDTKAMITAIEALSFTAKTAEKKG